MTDALTPQQVETLGAIADRPLSAPAIADRLGIASSTAFMRLARMERRGIVFRAFPPEGEGWAYVWAPAVPVPA